MPLEQERESLLQVSYFSTFDVLATSDSNKDFEEFKAAKCIVFVLVHVDFFEVCRLKVRIYEPSIDSFVRDARLLAELKEWNSLVVRWLA